MRCDEADGWRRVPNALKTIRAAAHICRASSKEINNRIAQIIAIEPDRSFSAKPIELYAASASPRTIGCPPTDNGGKSELPNPKILGLLRLDWPKSICRAPTVRIGRLPETLQRSVETARSRADHEEERYEKRARRRRGCRGILSLGL